MFVDRRLARYHFSIGVNLSKETCNALQFGDIASLFGQIHADGKMLTDCSAHSFT